MKRLWLLFIPLLFAPHLFAASNDALNGFCQLGGVKVLTQGANSTTTVQASYPRCSVKVVLTGTTTLAPIFNATGVPLANPFTARTDGSWIFYAATGVGYDVVMSGGTPLAFPTPFTLTNVVFGGGGSTSGCTTDCVLTDPTLSQEIVQPVGTEFRVIRGSNSIALTSAGVLSVNAALSLPALSDGCLGLASGIVTSTGVACGGGVVTFNTRAGAVVLLAGDVSGVGGLVSGSTAGGDLSGTYPNPGVAQVNGAAIPASALALGSNSSRQIITATVQGVGTKLLSFSGTTPTNLDVIGFDNTGTAVDLGINAASIPQTNGNNAFSLTNQFIGTTLFDSVTPATSGANQNSPRTQWSGNYWNGSITTGDTFTLQDVISAGTNPAVTFTLSHLGSSGLATFNVGVPLVLGTITGLTQCLTVSTTGQVSGTGSACGAGGGGVSSVALSLPSIFTVSGSPVTSSGTLTGTLATQSANLVFAGPATGTAAPTFRALVAGDLPLGSSSAFGALKCGSGTTCTSGTITVSAGGTVTTSGTPTNGFFPIFTASTAIGNSHLDDGITTVGVLTATEPITVADTTDPTIVLLTPNGIAPAVTAGSAGWGVAATLTTGGFYRMPDAPGSGLWTAVNASGIVTNTFTPLQGTDTHVLTSGTVSGTSVLLCTDALGGATTASCPGTTTIASGTSAMGTSAIASGACATVVTTTATGVASTDAIAWNPNASIKAVTGYTPSTSGGLTIAGYPTTNAVNWDVCNWTSASITPGAVTLNWRVTR